MLPSHDSTPSGLRGRRAARSVAMRAAVCTAGLAVALGAGMPGQAPADELPPELPVDVQEASVQAPQGLAFSSFDPATRTIHGTSSPNSTVVLVDAAGVVGAQAPVNGSGSFRLVVPDGLVALDSYVLRAYDEGWSQVGEDLPGTAFAGVVADSLAAQAARELADILTAIESRPSLGVASTSYSVAAEPVEPSEGMPVLPYALGAGSALLAAGAVAGAAAGLLRLRRLGEEAVDARVEPVVDQTGAVEDPVKDHVVPATAARPTRTEQVAPDDGLDELERMALAFVREDDPAVDEPTDVLEAVPGPMDTAEFARTARILAFGSGTVHHVGASAVDEPEDVPEDVPEEPDWISIALSELGEDRDGSSPNQPTADFSALTTGNMKIVDQPAPGTGYVAPIVGPRAVSDTDIERHLNRLSELQSTDARALRERDQQFTAARKAPGMGAEDPVSTSVWLAAALRGRGGRKDEQRGEGGVPVISRGSSLRVVVPEIEPVDYVSVRTPSPYGVAAAAAAVKYGVPSLAPNFGSDYAAQIASNVYSDENITGSMKAVFEAPRQVTQVERSLAAAYASAVYSTVAQAYGADEEAYGSHFADATSESGKTEAMRSLDDSGVIEHSFSPASLSAEYIDLMVQDEFEHRHDSASQRNAALGRMRVVNGSASSPVPLDSGLKHIRHRA